MRTPTLGFLTGNESGAPPLSQTLSPLEVPSLASATLHGEVPPAPQLISCVAGVTDSSTKYASVAFGARSLIATGSAPVPSVGWRISMRARGFVRETVGTGLQI